MILKILAALVVTVTCSILPAEAQNSSAGPAPVYASEACTFGCVQANNYDFIIYEGPGLRNYRICVDRSYAKLKIDGVEKEVPSAKGGGRACRDFTAKEIMLVRGEVVYGLLP